MKILGLSFNKFNKDQFFQNWNSILRKYFPLILLLVVLIAYGQTLGMYVWKDDNAIFFKFNHLQEQTGYLGKGLLGEGPYRFSVAPYWLIYQLFGYQQIWPYYLLTLVFYFLTTLCVYKLFSDLISPRSGRIAGVLFTCGYIASEGFIWLASSMILNLSIILSCLLLIFYRRLSKSPKQSSTFFYLISLGLYCLACFLTSVRIHYFILMVILFDLLFVSQKWNLKFWFKSFKRLAPFLLVFIFTFFFQGFDPRGSLSFNLIKEILSGRIYQLYSFLGTLGKMVLPDPQTLWLTEFLLSRSKSGLPLLVFKIIISILILLNGYFVVHFAFQKKGKGRKEPYLFLIILVFNFIWLFLSKTIVSAPQNIPCPGAELSLFLGGLFLEILAIAFYLIDRRFRRQFFFLSSWCLLNLWFYSAYQPSSLYASVDRYLAHSFVPLVGLFSLAFAEPGLSQKRFKREKAVSKLTRIWERRMSGGLIILWAGLNLVNSVSYQHQLLLERSIPARKFYQELKNLLPELEKGSLLYFDLAEEDRKYFNAAFSVGQMPEETALAWRYGLDRYDFQIFTDFEELAQEIEKTNLPLDNLFTFWYSGQHLVQTSDDLRTFFSQGKSSQELKADLPVTSDYSIKQSRSGLTELSQKDLMIEFKEPIKSLSPVEMILTTSSQPLSVSEVNFPFYFSKAIADPDQTLNLNFLEKVKEYQDYKSWALGKADYRASSSWQARTVDLVHDLNYRTVWQPDRTVWEAEKGEVTLDLLTSQTISGLVWVNGFSNSTPTEYLIRVSVDNQNWQIAKEVSRIQKLDDRKVWFDSFSPVTARYLQFQLKASLNNDASEIAELWPVPAELAGYDLGQVEQFLNQPFSFVESPRLYQAILQTLDYQGKLNLFWLGNKNLSWTTSDQAVIQPIYNGISREHRVLIPAGGTEIRAIKLANFNFPGKLSVERIRVNYPKP